MIHHNENGHYKTNPVENFVKEIDIDCLGTGR
jgi:hypothetical protein